MAQQVKNDGIYIPKKEMTPLTDSRKKELSLACIWYINACNVLSLSLLRQAS